MAIERRQRIDPVPHWKVMLRSMQPLRMIRKPELQGPFSGDGFIEAVARVQREAASGRTVKDCCVALWKLERLGFSYCRHGEGTLQPAAVPIEVQPIAHTGLGLATVEEMGLQAEKIKASIEDRAHADFGHFAYESVGCALGVLTNTGFRRLFELFAGVRFAGHERIDPKAFMSHFPADTHSLLSHGYGRTLYFAHRGLLASLDSAVSSALDTTAAVQGVAFAYLMLNFADLDQVLEVRPDLASPALTEAFVAGLEFALAMLSWTFPGALSGLPRTSTRQGELIERAESLVSVSRDSGYFNSPLLAT